MNWVGGARSRVRQHGEKKLQKEFFERKRMANKVQRIKPSLSKMKAAVSQDLLFLRTNKAEQKPKRVPSKLIPKVLSLDSTKPGPAQPPRSHRDLELPMSPIGQPSTLEIMDTSAVHTERCDRIRDESSWSGGGGMMCVRDPPRVSTQKIPHRTVLDSFGPPRVREIVSPEVELPGRVPMVPAGPSHLDTDTGAPHLESLFPQPSRKTNQQGAGHRPIGQWGNGRRYNMDDIFSRKMDFNSKSKAQVSAAFQQNNAATHEPPPEPSCSGAQDRGPGARQPTIFTIAKGGGRFVKKNVQTKDFKRPQDIINHQVTRNRTHARNARNAKNARNARHLEDDGDAMLELHYSDKPAMEDQQQQDRIENQKVPEAAVGFPWSSSDPAARLELDSEESWPKETRKKSLEASTSMDFNESIFGPLHRKKRKRPEQVTRRPNRHHQPTFKRDKLDLDESIFRPLKQMKKKQELSSSRCPSAAIASLDESVFGPLNRRNQYNKRNKVHTSKIAGSRCVSRLDSTQYEESIIGPIAKEKMKVVTKRVSPDKRIVARKSNLNDNGFKVTSDLFNVPSTSTDLHSSTMHDESVLGPLLQATAITEHKERRLEHSRDNRGEGSRRNPSTFEVMMKMLEEPSKETTSVGGPTGCSGSTLFGVVCDSDADIAVPGELLKQSAPPEYDEDTHPCTVNSDIVECLPAESYGIAALPRVEASLEQESIHEYPDVNTVRVKSCFIELMSLEEESRPPYDGKTQSQDYMLTGGNSEDPLGQRWCSSQESQPVRCLFDSSQELSARGKGRKTDGVCGPRTGENNNHSNHYKDSSGKKNEMVRTDSGSSGGKENIGNEECLESKQCEVHIASVDNNSTEGNATSDKVLATTTLHSSEERDLSQYTLPPKTQAKLSSMFPHEGQHNEAVVQCSLQSDPINSQCVGSNTSRASLKKVQLVGDCSTNENMCLALEKQAMWLASQCDSNSVGTRDKMHHKIQEEGDADKALSTEHDLDNTAVIAEGEVRSAYRECEHGISFHSGSPVEHTAVKHGVETNEKHSENLGVQINTDMIEEKWGNNDTRLHNYENANINISQATEITIDGRCLPVATDYAASVCSAASRLCSPNITKLLHSEIKQLKEKLEQTESTVVWQQIMIRLYETDRKK